MPSNNCSSSFNNQCSRPNLPRWSLHYQPGTVRLMLGDKLSTLLFHVGHPTLTNICSKRRLALAQVRQAFVYECQRGGDQQIVGTALFASLRARRRNSCRSLNFPCKVDHLKLCSLPLGTRRQAQLIARRFTCKIAPVSPHQGGNMGPRTHRNAG